MRRKSHQHLGRYLADNYMSHLPGHYVRVFLIGCVEPDLNPVTYLKGSLRFQWLRGHNYCNARRFMRQISRRLEKKRQLRLFDYYTLGKLIHYTADAFTLAHNDFFPSRLADHREYEEALQEHFLQYLREDPEIDPVTAATVMDAIYQYHRQYEHQHGTIATDARFALNICCCVVALLITRQIL